MAAIGCLEKCKHCFSDSVCPKVSKKCIVYQISKNSERNHILVVVHSELDYIVGILPHDANTFFYSCYNVLQKTRTQTMVSQSTSNVFKLKRFTSQSFEVVQSETVHYANIALL